MRIVIVGNSGSGKSTFADWLSKQRRLPVLHVDQILWLPGWKARDELELSAELAAFESKTNWIIDGVGPKALLERRVALADHVILMDTPFEECRSNAIARADAQKTSENKFIDATLKYAEVMELQHRVIDSFESDWMPQLRERARCERRIVYSHYRDAYADDRWMSVDS